MTRGRPRRPPKPGRCSARSPPTPPDSSRSRLHSRALETAFAQAQGDRARFRQPGSNAARGRYDRCRAEQRAQPSGPRANVAALEMRANGRCLARTRDPVELSTSAVNIPAGATGLVVTFAYLAATGGNDGSTRLATPNMLTSSSAMRPRRPTSTSGPTHSARSSTRLCSASSPIATTSPATSSRARPRFPRFPRLERTPGPDVLSEIAKPL